ncbi:hypothetical protein [Streptomyces sp. PT19]|uniref:hypothetical protein n=1 Tax=Streptomyces sp. PT19 TaxID=3452239 RepID=UPI003F7F124D
MQFQNEHELRALLRTCIDPGPGRDKRTPTRLVEALPHEYAAALDQFAPRYLGAMGRTAAELTGRADDMRHAYASSVLAWIRDESPSDRLLDLATEATAHVRTCPWCSSGGVLAARCEDGRRLAAAFLAPASAPGDRAQHCDGAALTHDETGICNHPAAAADEEAPCAHESWDVTSEYADREARVWVKSRRCNDCGEPLPEVREAEPHFHSPAEVAVLFGHATPEQAAAAFLDEDDEDDEDRPALPAALPWLSVLRGEEFGNLLGEIVLAMQQGTAPRDGESTDDRHRRSVGYVGDVLAAWRDAMEHRRPTWYLTRDGRVWTHQGEHQAKEGPALYESPTSPRAYTVAELRDMYGWVAGVEGEPPADGVMSTTFEDYARTCRAQSLVPHTTVLVESAANAEVYAAVHVSLDPHTELSPTAVDAIRTAVCDGLAFRED